MSGEVLGNGYKTETRGDEEVLVPNDGTMLDSMLRAVDSSVRVMKTIRVRDHLRGLSVVDASAGSLSGSPTVKTVETSG